MDWHPVISVQQQTPDNDFCHFSISAFQHGSHTESNDDPVTRTWKMTQMTHWPGDPMTQFHVWWATFTLRTLTSPHPRWHHDRFSHFSNAHACDTQTTLSCCKSCRRTKHSVPRVLPALPASYDQPEKTSQRLHRFHPLANKFEKIWTAASLGMLKYDQGTTN